MNKFNIIHRVDRLLICALFLCTSFVLQGQLQEVLLGQYSEVPHTVQSSSEVVLGSAQSTLDQSGYLPNMNAASRFLTHSAMGHNYEDILALTDEGLEDWIDNQTTIPVSFSLLEKVIEYHNYRRDSLNNPQAPQAIRFYDFAWWQYHMTSNDVLRQKIAFALSQLFVISRFSSFGSRSYAFSSFYDIFLNNAFGNYKDILTEVTYHPGMGLYLTYLNNPKTDTLTGTFPDENYAREVMQLFSIGLVELNIDGTPVLDNNGNPIPTYDNNDIAEFSKIFTGLSWHDRDSFFKGAMSDSSYIIPMKMFNEYHEPGVKNLLNGYQVPDRNPVNGIADINDAIENLFNHANVGPFVSKFLIQRLVTSNPEPEYISRVAEVFNDNGQGVRGDLATVVKAILLDPAATDCQAKLDDNFGKLREPFINYFRINKAFDASTPSGNYRNIMETVQEYVGQKPNTSPSVFNFFQSDYTPIGPIEDANKVGPEFQIVDSRSITGYINGIYRWVVEDNPADEAVLFSGESSANLNNDRSSLDFSDETLLATDDVLHILVDRLNLILAHGRLSNSTKDAIVNTVKNFDDNDEEDLEFRAKVAIYLVLSSPEYLINR